jgi:hypothetical protein
MKNYTKPTLVLIFCLSFLQGCEYQSEKDFFVNVEPPPSTHNMTLTLSSSSDTIRIFCPTTLTYNINTFGLKFLGGFFSLGDKQWEVKSDTGRITLSPGDFSAGKYQLVLNAYTNSGSGSIADFFGGEGYNAVKNWPMLIDASIGAAIKVTISVAADGYFKVSWPKCEQYNFVSYEVKGLLNLHPFSKVYTNADITSYIDSSFVGGTGLVAVNLTLTNNYISGIYTNVNEPIPVLKFEELGIDSLRISWEKSKYRAHYRMEKQYITIFESSVKTSLTIPNPGFGSYVQFNLFTSPVIPCSENYSYTRLDSRYYTQGVYLASNWPTWGYNSMDKAVYVRTYDYIQCYDVQTFNLLRNYSIANLLSQGQYSCPTNSTKVAAIASDKIYVFNDKTLQNPVVIPYNIGNNSLDQFYFTDNDMIAVLRPSRYDLISIASKSVVLTFPVTDYPVYSKWACSSTSKDGRYACIVTMNGIKVYDLGSGTATLIYSDSRVYRSALFDINNPNRLFLTFYSDNTLEIRNMPDFSLVSSSVLPDKGEVMRNIDPESGYLLMTDYKYLYLFDLIKSKVIFKMVSTDSRPQLYDNRLFSNTGYGLDISKYLKK